MNDVTSPTEYPMLEYLKLRNVGPAPEMHLELGSRINVITGDNGLGKSFLLDIAWWALTRHWPEEVNPKLTSGLVARPVSREQAEIECAYEGRNTTVHYKSTYDRYSEYWIGPPVPDPLPYPGLVLYAQADGGFAVWDPTRNPPYAYRVEGKPVRPPAYVFSKKEVWDGLEIQGTKACNGLLADWAFWQNEGGGTFRRFRDALKAISPSSKELLIPGELGTLKIGDSRWIPSLKTPHGQEVLIVHASAAVQRIASLIYLLIWSWEEHLRTAERLGEEPTGQITFLIDEIEGHLHPRWQRTIVRGLLKVIKGLAKETKTQLVMATHSPLLLASLEPFFDSDQDAWFDLDLEGQNGSAPQVILRKRDYIRRGDVSNWLTSEAFDLDAARSLEAEAAIIAARKLLRQPGEQTLERAKTVDRQLREAGLPDIDPFWVRWGAFLERLENQG